MEADYKKAVDRLANNITQKLKRAEKKLVKNFKKATQFVADWKRYLDNFGGSFNGRRK